MNNNKIILFLVSFAAIVLAAVVGGYVGQGEYYRLLMGTAAVSGLCYLLFLSSGWIAFAFLYCALSFNIQPMGFAMADTEISSLLAGLYVMMMCWRHGSFEQSRPTALLKPFTNGLIVFCVYLGLHFLFNKTDPFHAETIAWTNAAKTYHWMIAGFFLVAVARFMPKGCWLPKKPVQLLAFLLLIGTLTNLGIRLYGIFILGISSVDMSTNEQAASSVFIPFINLTDNIYILRSLGPVCTLFAAVMLTSRAPYAGRVRARMLGVILAIVGLAASLVSMGRAALLLGLLVPLVALILRKRIFLVAIFGGIGLLCIMAARIAFEVDQGSIPPSVQRALAMIPGMDMQEARANIDSSSDWRYKLFFLAIDDWKQSTRTILSGRSVYAFTERDAAQLAGTDIFSYTMISSLRRGSTHNLLTDLLVPVGVIGLIFYFVVYGLLLRGVIKIKNSTTQTSEVQDLGLISVVGLCTSLLVACFGGGFLQGLTALGVAAMVVVANREATAKKQA